MDPAVRDFVDVHKARTQKPLTVYDWRKSQNHEIWRTCKDCNEEFDLRKCLDMKCPKCGSANIRF